ncbi:MAG TPA: TIGR02444 family protein [Stellaceae bacterium]|nr:TIGR02444 family protein [Stellaceae bacterium]
MAEAFEEFWRFALDFYARPGVAPACLELQDRHGKDVLIALFACWVGISGRGRLDAAALAKAEATARPWRSSVVEPLRRTRHALKGIGGAENLYSRMKKIELDAEKIAMERLAPLAPAAAPAVPPSARSAAARENLTLYLADDAEAAAAPLLAALDQTAGEG